MFDNWNQQKPTLKINEISFEIVTYPQGKKKICPTDIGLAEGDDSYLISIQKDILVNDFDVEIISAKYKKKYNLLLLTSCKNSFKA